MRTLQPHWPGSLAALLSVALAGCAMDDEADDDDLAFDGKGDAPGLVEHDSPLQEIGEIGSTFTATARAHAWRVTLGTTEEVTMFTALFSGSEGRAVDTVLYLYRQQPDGAWGHFIRKNDNSGDTAWSRIEETLEPGEYRVIVAARRSTVRGEFAINFGCADRVCEFVAPGDNPDPEEPGKGVADEPGGGVVSFEVPLMAEDGTLLSSFNDDLAAAGLPTFPDHVTVASDSATPTAEWETFEQLAERDDVLAITEAELVMFSDPDQLLAGGFCYRGDGTGLADFTHGFTDDIFSDQYVVWGWRSGEKSAFEEWHEPTESSGILEEWQSYDPTGTDVLIVYSTDDDGTPRVSTVPRCD